MKATNIKTLKDAQRFCEGVINDFENGISNKEETLEQFRKYTFAIHDQFWRRAKREVEKNPNYFNETSKRDNKKLNQLEL